MAVNKTAVGLALLTGVAIGAGIGILMAPDKGSETRKKIKDGLDDAKKKVGDKIKDVKAKAKADAEGSYDELVSTLHDKSEDVISFLENKLAALKKEVAKF
jgi:gas vesicle protein